MKRKRNMTPIICAILNMVIANLYLDESIDDDKMMLI